MLWVFLFKLWVFYRTQTVFTVVCLQVYYRESQNKYFFEEIWDPPQTLRQLVGSTFNIEGQWSSSYIYVLIRYSYMIHIIVCVDENCQAAILFLAICPGFSNGSQGRNWNFTMKPVYLLLVIFEGTMPMLRLYIT